MSTGDQFFKKALLSSFVVIGFVLYSLHARHEQHIITITPPIIRRPALSTPSATPSPVGYKDGTYTGNPADAFYGTVQIQAVINGGKITSVAFLNYPNDRNTSVTINRQAIPYLQQEAITAQSAQVDGVSGATDTSQAFRESLASALSKAAQQ